MTPTFGPGGPGSIPGIGIIFVSKMFFNSTLLFRVRLVCLSDISTYIDKTKNKTKTCQINAVKNRGSRNMYYVAFIYETNGTLP